MRDRWDYFECDGAVFRRPAGSPGGVTEILHGRDWQPYAGDRTKPVIFGNRIPAKAEFESQG